VPRKGVFRFLESVFRDQEVEAYDTEMRETCGEKYEKAKKNQTALYKKWRTFQMSDHSPLWVGCG